MAKNVDWENVLVSAGPISVQPYSIVSTMICLQWPRAAHALMATVYPRKGSQPNSLKPIELYYYDSMKVSVIVARVLECFCMSARFVVLRSYR